MARCLVTGASGFIGRHLVAYLKKKGYQVQGVSRKNDIDITNIDSVQRLFKKHTFDYIFHLAAAPALSHPSHIEFETNVTGTYHLLRLLSQHPCKGCIIVGTSLEYGYQKKPMKENSAPLPRFMHAGTKAAATMLTTAMAHEHNMPIVVVRPFSIYGPGEVRPRFIPVLIRSALQNKTIKVHSGVHDWVYIDDFIDAIVQLAMKAKKLKGEIFNIGTGIQTSNMDVANTVRAIIKKPIQIKKINAKFRTYDTSSWVANTSKLKSVIHWTPISLKKGLIKTIEGSH